MQANCLVSEVSPSESNPLARYTFLLRLLWDPGGAGGGGGGGGGGSLDKHDLMRAQELAT